jgi:hypothetical protein
MEGPPLWQLELSRSRVVPVGARAFARPVSVLPGLRPPRLPEWISNFAFKIAFRVCPARVL